MPSVHFMAQILTRTILAMPRTASKIELESRPSGNMRQRVWNGVRWALTDRSTGETTSIGW